MERGSGRVRTRALWQRAITMSKDGTGGGTGGGGGGGASSGGSGVGGAGSVGASMFKSSRNNSFQLLAASLVEQKNRDKDLKAKTEELEDTKRKLDQEKDSKQKLQKQVQTSQCRLQDEQDKLQKSQDNVEKLRLENKKKTEQIEKMERSISHMEDRIRNLEIRASEVEKAELTLESTRRNLEGSQHECRSKEGEILRLQDKFDKTCQVLDQAKNTIKEMEKKIEDLKHQVRYELMKNENIERGLETIPHLKDDIADRDRKIVQLEKDLDERTALLTSSRKAVRDYKDRIRDMEREEAAGENQKKELELAQQEVSSLKHLIAGKDALVLRKCQALEQAKLVIESLPRTQDEKEKLKKIQQLLTKLASMQNDNHLHANGLQQNGDINTNRGKHPLTPRNRTLQDGGRELSVDTSPFHHRDTDYSLLERCLQENRNHHNTNNTATTPTQTAVVHPVRRSASLNEHHPPRSRQSPRPHSRATRDTHTSCTRPGTSSNVYRPETRATSRFPPSLDYPLGGSNLDDGETWAQMSHAPHHPSNKQQQLKARPYSAAVTSPYPGGELDVHGDSCVDSDSGSEFSTSGKDDVALARMQLTARQKDEVLAAAIAVGDRVSITVAQKPPRYGRKKPKPVIYTGIVKYVGGLDKEQYDARIYCGVRLDEPIGEKDGVYKGKRYMFTPNNHAKFFKIRDVNTILDVKSGQYIPASRLLLKHLKKSQSFHRGRDELINETM
ncbi:myosin heavy chain, clone 203-like isoform X2 [Littorina saxatilis]|uniref:CAP-Gly domain-containing protein n=1 Tax=Littorina saxatilis TaxID=31220 RepID=A0AAN9C4A0_9CAEN